MRTPKALEDRLWPKVEKTPACWVWTGSVSRNSSGDYGVIYVHPNGTKYVHRLAYELVIGPIPQNHDLHHLCSNTLCVNPAHLQPLTRSNHSKIESKNAKKTHCPQGHPYDEENTYTHRGKRGCRICRKEAVRRFYGR